MVASVSTKENLPKLETTFHVKVNGSSINIKLGALEFNHVLSPCEKYLYVQLCNSTSEDSGKFIKLDVTTGRKIYSVGPEWGWARGYTFNHNGNICVETDHYGTWLVNDDGDISDRAGYYMRRVKTADYGTMRALPIFFELHGKTPETCAEAMEALERFLSTCSSMFHGLSYGALALKSRAEIQAFLGDNSGALQSCVDALCLDPKVTVKRMLNSLSKKLNLDKDTLKPSDWVESLKVDIEANRNIEINKIEENRNQIKDKDVIVVSEMKIMNKEPHAKNNIMKYFLLIVVLVAAVVILFK
ncbi:TPA: hypothetical protein ACJIK4_001268 [Kluyvera cryocrescens]|nr:hypothetical protein [Enterobacter asburiae]